MKFERVHPSGWDAGDATSWRTGQDETADAERHAEYHADDTAYAGAGRAHGDGVRREGADGDGAHSDGVHGTPDGEQDESGGQDSAHQDSASQDEAVRRASLASLREDSARTMAGVRSSLDVISDSMVRIQEAAERERTRRSPPHPTDSPPSNFSAARFTKGGND